MSVEIESNVVEAAGETLYVHAKRAEWGLAILTRDERTQRTFQFQDGRMRTFKQGWFELMEPVDKPSEDAARIHDELMRKHGVATARRKLIADARSSGQQVTTFPEQVQVFKALFPEGFEDANWLAKIRGDADSDRKSLREPALAAAGEVLARERMDTLLAEGRGDELWQSVVELLGRTDLVTTQRDVGLVADLDPAARSAFVRAARELLHGEGEHAERFDAFVATLSGGGDAGPSWQLATVLPALWAPGRHVCVRPSSFRLQSRWFHPGLDLSGLPDGGTYDRVRVMLRDLSRALEREELPPGDQMDLHDFIRLTLSPKARQVLDRLRGAGA